MTNPDTTAGFKEYHELRKEYLSTTKNKIHKSQAHHLLLHWRRISDAQMEVILNSIFG